MSLYVIGTPIGNEEDLSPHARKTLQECEWVIGEERKTLSKRLRMWGIKPHAWTLLNEHSSGEDLQELLELCKAHTVGLVTDCGTPGFCDPGADLVKLCRKNKVDVHSVPGPSSLMTFLSLTGYQLPEFYFVGFLPANNEKRNKKLQKLKSSQVPLIIMDTPYRLQKTLRDIEATFPNNRVVLGIELSKEEEKIYEGRAAEILDKLSVKKAEFLLLVFS